MAGTLDFDGVAIGSLSITPLQVRIDDAIRLATACQLSLAFHAGCIAGVANTVAAVSALGVRFEFRLLYQAGLRQRPHGKGRDPDRESRRQAS
jgi:hypothetical protein